jgi:hypothetical protein
MFRRLNLRLAWPDVSWIARLCASKARELARPRVSAQIDGATQPADIFISYAREDQAAALELAYLLEAEGYSVWWDRSLEGADDYQIVIMQKIVEARVALVIWSGTSAQSQWVRAEAGAAQRAGKLIPLKVAAMAYEQIPLPFNLLHAIELDNRAQIKAEVAARLAKPVQSPPRWKKVRYELLSWAGVVGASVTLAAHLEGFMQLSLMARYIVQNWAGLLLMVWRNVLFFVPQLARTDAIVLSIVVFTANTLFLSPVVEAEKTDSAAGRAGLWTALSFVVLLMLFSLGIYDSIGQRGMLYELTRSAVALAGAELDALNPLRQSIFVILFVMFALAMALSLVVGANLAANRHAAATHVASLPAVSLRLHRIVIGVACVLVLSELSATVEQWMAGARPGQAVTAPRP